MTSNDDLAFATHPEVLAAFEDLKGAIRGGMDLRRYALVTLAVARQLRSSYCALAHGQLLVERFGDDVRAIALDRRNAGLAEVDIAVMDFAEKVAIDATSIDDHDRKRLRDLGLSDDDIMDVVLAAALRCFYSKTLDALDVRADATYRELPEELREVLVVGRPIADA